MQFNLIQFKFECGTAQLRLQLFFLFSCYRRYCHWGGWAQRYVTFIELIHLNDLNDDVTFIFWSIRGLEMISDNTRQIINLLAGLALWACACKISEFCQKLIGTIIRVLMRNPWPYCGTVSYQSPLWGRAGGNVPVVACLISDKGSIENLKY